MKTLLLYLATAIAEIGERGKPNEMDFPVPIKPLALRVAVYGNSVTRWRGQTFHQLVLRGEAHVYRSGWN